MPRGKKKLTAKQLELNGAKPFRVRKRLAEEQAALLPPPAVQAMLEMSRRENATLATRCVEGEILCRTLTGEKFGFPKYHWITQARDYCKSVVADPERSEFAHEYCRAFLTDLADPSHGYHLDPVAADFLTLAYRAFETGETQLSLWRLLEGVQFWCWTKPDGTYRLPDEELLELDDRDIKVQDQAILLLKAEANQNKEKIQ